ncbi:hypothetical protein CK203_029978 [Vitis vinifera]|uniref:Uncharacterized protein n=1 Tax=Vitis vinifera TaxID=29760 RepID=A0A438IKC0_VITVI|nr:hypothetical protein CK203_029978 [Vitis vinifera]
MPKVMLVVLIEMRNIALLQPRAGSDDTPINYFFQVKYEQCGWVSLEEDCISLGFKEKPTCDGCDRQCIISLITCHGNPLSGLHCREVRLTLFNCDRLIPMTYSFNGGWLATSGKEIHVDLVGREYRNVIDGKEVKITNL